jgi:hypothetical protein
MDLNASGQKQTGGFCEYSDEPSGSIRADALTT